MRITGGRYRGRVLRCPPGEIRPAMDRMRESVFAILGSLEGCSFLDLFSGSGIIGVEAASRGAEPVVLVERDARKRPVLTANVAFVETEIRAVFAPAERYLRTCGRTFDYVFIDPPFAYPRKARLLGEIGKLGVVVEGGMVLLHHPTSETVAEAVPPLSRTDQRKYGGSTVSFYTAG